MADKEQVKNAIDSLGSTFEEFKKTNDERLAQIEKKGSADAVTSEKLARIEKDLDKIEEVNQAVVKQNASAQEQADKISRMEKMLSRPISSKSEQIKVDEQKQAFDNYLRKGKDNITPNELKVLTASNDTAGGYLAPPEYVRELTKTITELSPIRSISRVRSTTNRSVQIPERTGQFAAVFVAEQGTRSETTGYATGLREIPTHELYALVDISEQELEDSVFNLEQEMSLEFGEQFAKAEGTAFVSGNAVGKPEGFLTNSEIGTVNSGASAALTADGLISLYHEPKAEYAQNGSFVFSRSTLAAIRKLKTDSNDYVFQPGNQLSGGMVATILGAPYIQATDMPAVGAGNKAIAFGDFRRGYMIVDRVNLAILRDPFTQATSGNVRYVARKRVGAQVILPEAIKTQTVSA
jgi:HK97 family phage major capsid protein